MDSGKQLGFSPAQKVYRPSPKRYLKLEVLISVFPVVAFGFLLLTIPLIQIFTWHPERVFSALFICLVFIGPFEAFFVFYFLWRTHVRLVTSGEGIGYSTAGYRIFTPWDNIAGVGMRQELFQSPSGSDYLGPTRSWTVEIRGLELQQPAPVYKAHPLVRLFLRLHHIERPSFFIPISNVIENWQDSEVAADIQRYAPQVAMKMPSQRRDVEELISALKDPADEIRKSAARTLGEIKDPRAVDPLIAALQDSVYGVREAAAYALGNIGDPRAVDPLLYVWGKDRDLAAMVAIQRVLVKIGDARAEKLLLALQKNLADGDPRRDAAALVLEQIQSSRRKSR